MSYLKNLMSTRIYISNTTVSAKFLISKIKKESQITESIIKNSVYFSNIEQSGDI